MNGVVTTALSSLSQYGVTGNISACGMFDLEAECLLACSGQCVQITGNYSIPFVLSAFMLDVTAYTASYTDPFVCQNATFTPESASTVHAANALGNSSLLAGSCSSSA